MEKKYVVSAEFTVEIPKGVDPDLALSAVEELCDGFASHMSMIGTEGFRSSYGPIVRTDAVLNTRRIPMGEAMATAEEIEHENDGIVPIPVIIEAIRRFLGEPKVQVTMYEPIRATEFGVWVAGVHAGTWYLDGQNPDGSPNIEIENLNTLSDEQ